MALCRARDRLRDPCGSLPTQEILRFCENVREVTILAVAGVLSEEPPFLAMARRDLCGSVLSPRTDIASSGINPFFLPRRNTKDPELPFPRLAPKPCKSLGTALWPVKRDRAQGGVTLHTSLYKKVIQVRNK